MASTDAPTTGNVLREIESLKHGAYAEALDSARIYELEQQFNDLADEEEAAKARLRPGTSCDPFVILPPELWPDITGWDQDELLVWTLVSTRWRKAILSLSSSWKMINLELETEDLLARTILSLKCSAGANLSIWSSITADQWEDFIPLIVPEAHRIELLSIAVRYGETVDYMRILGTLGKLPILTELYLPQDYSSTYMDDWKSYTPQQPSGSTMFPAIIPSFASLEQFYEIRFKAEDLNSEAHLRLRNMFLYAGDEGWERLLSMPHLDDLDLHDRGSEKETTKLARRTNTAVLLHVRSFQYMGRDLQHALGYIGSELRELSGQYVHFDQLPRLLVALSPFSNLASLSLHLWQDGREPLSFGGGFSLTCVKELRLSLGCHWRLIQYADGMRQQEHIVADMFYHFISALPAVEDLSVSNSTSTPGLLRYACSLFDLKWFYAYLTTSSSESEEDAGIPISFSSSTLQSINWRENIPPDGIMDLFVCSSTKKLRLNPLVRRPLKQLYEPQDPLSPVILPRLRTSPGQLSKITELILVIKHRFVCDLDCFPVLRDLQLEGDPSATLASDLLEEIIVRPDVCPRLDKIAIRGDYLDWDVLLVMLERRNIFGGAGTNRISEVSFNLEIPYRLLHPISALLRGRYPEREDLASYSICALQASILDRNISGCDRCIRMFRQCSSPVLKDTEDLEWSYRQLHDADIRLAIKYSDPPDYSNANPPLASSVVDWLQGKHQRRMAFVEKRKEMKVHRTESCREPWIFKPTKQVRSGTLHGATFEDALLREQARGKDCAGIVDGEHCRDVASTLGKPRSAEAKFI